jgi:hypothetical protein
MTFSTATWFAVTVIGETVLRPSEIGSVTVIE